MRSFEEVLLVLLHVFLFIFVFAIKSIIGSLFELEG